MLKRFDCSAAVWLRGVLLSLLMLTGCASMTPGDTEAWREAQRSVLKERAAARWQALIAGDFETAYSFTSPSYRDVVSLQQFKGQFGQAVVWRMARIENIQYDDPTVAVVTAAVTYRTSTRGGEIESTRTMTEKWLYSKGGWWYTSVK